MVAQWGYNFAAEIQTLHKMKTIEGYDVKIFTDTIDEKALEQIKELLSIDVFSDKKIRIMPDVHAGRVLSRSQAYQKITMEDFEASMQGIYSESVNAFTRDESPMVYKPASEIIANIGDTVTIDTIIRPVFNFKASK